MYKEILDEKIASAIKNRTTIELEVWRSIKTEFVKYETDENVVKTGDKLTDAMEIKLISKMCLQRKDSIDQYKKGGREDLAKKEEAELEILSQLLPKEATTDELDSLITSIIKDIETTKGNGYKVSMVDMKTVIERVKEKYPTANGGVVVNMFKTLC